jgi:hypothetical protein
MDLLRWADAQVVDFFARLDPQQPSPFGVAWAGDEWSPNWFDIAREYTEKWHHQQQIRDAVGKPGLVERRYLYPVLDTFLRGAPHAYRHADAPDGTGVTIAIRGDVGGTWHLRRQAESWDLVEGLAAPPAVTVTLDPDTAWRLWTKGLDRREARARAAVDGDEALAAPLFGMVTIMA